MVRDKGWNGTVGVAAYLHVFTGCVIILQLLEKGNKLVLEQIVTTIATVADAVEEHFVPHYEEFIPSLKFIMANATSRDYRLLRGKTIECISLIGLAVGQEKVREMYGWVGGVRGGVRTR